MWCFSPSWGKSSSASALSSIVVSKCLTLTDIHSTEMCGPQLTAYWNSGECCACNPHAQWSQWRLTQVVRKNEVPVCEKCLWGSIYKHNHNAELLYAYASGAVAKTGQLSLLLKFNKWSSSLLFMSVVASVFWKLVLCLNKVNFYAPLTNSVLTFWHKFKLKSRCTIKIWSTVQLYVTNASPLETSFVCRFSSIQVIHIPYYSSTLVIRNIWGGWLVWIPSLSRSPSGNSVTWETSSDAKVKLLKL